MPEPLDLAEGLHIVHPLLAELVLLLLARTENQMRVGVVGRGHGPILSEEGFAQLGPLVDPVLVHLRDYFSDGKD